MITDLNSKALKLKYLRNSISNAISWGWLSILNIITIPYILNKLGYDSYGIFVLASTVIGYSAFLDLGIGDAIVKYIAHYYSLRDAEKTDKIVNSALVLFTCIGSLGGLLIYLFARRFAVNIFNIPNSLHATAIACFSLAGIGFFVNFILVIFSKIPEALQRFDVTSLNYVIIGSCTTFGSVLMIFLGFGVETLIVINAMGSLFALWLFYKAVKNLLPSLHVNMKFDYPMTRSLLKFGFFTIATRASGVLAESINQFFIGSIIGPTGVAIFGVPFKMVGRLSAGIQRIAFIIFPLSSQLHANNDIEKLQEVYSRVSRYIFIMASSIMIPAIAYAEPLLFYWIGKDFSGQGTHVFIMVSLGFLLISTTMVPGLFAMGMGKPEYNAFFSILTAFLNAAFIYPLTNEWGVNGASNAFFLSTLQAPFAVYVVTTKVVKVDWRIYISHVYVKGILLDLAFFVFYKFILINFIVGFFSFIFLFLVSILLMVYAGYWMGVERDDKKVIQGALRNLRNLLSSTE